MADMVAGSIRGFIATVVERIPELLAGAVMFLLFLAIAHGVRWALVRSTKGSKRANVGQVLGRLSYFAIMLLGALVALTIVVPSMTPGKLVSMLGIGGVAIGFAFKDIFQNMLAGVLLLWREPFRVGDEITSETFTGTVDAIDVRATLIRTYAGERVIVPNSQIYTQPVTVITAYGLLRSQYDIGIGYGDDIGRAKQIVQSILEATEGVMQDPKPDVLVWELAGSTVNLRARWWSKPQRSLVVRLRDSVLHQVRDRLTESGVDLPFPTSVVLFHDQSEEADGDRSKQREGWPVPQPRAPKS